MITYGVVEEKYVLGKSKGTAYGIAAYADAETDGTATIVASVNDISSDKDKVEEFAKICNRAKLSPRALKDAAEDFVEELYSVR